MSWINSCSIQFAKRLESLHFVSSVWFKIKIHAVSEQSFTNGELYQSPLEEQTGEDCFEGHTQVQVGFFMPARLSLIQYITAGSITLSHRWTCFCELENVSSSCWSLLLFYPPVTCSISRAWNTFSLYFHWFNPTRKSWSCHKLYLPLSHGASVRVLQQAADHPKFPGGAGSM